jgi:hypothetical protein
MNADFFFIRAVMYTVAILGRSGLLALLDCRQWIGLSKELGRIPLSSLHV